jgi:hypothetical protein
MKCICLVLCVCLCVPVYAELIDIHIEVSPQIQRIVSEWQGEEEYAIREYILVSLPDIQLEGGDVLRTTYSFEGNQKLKVSGAFDWLSVYLDLGNFVSPMKSRSNNGSALSIISDSENIPAEYISKSSDYVHFYSMEDDYYISSGFAFISSEQIPEDYVLLGEIIFECTIPTEAGGQPVDPFYYTGNDFSIVVDTITNDPDFYMTIVPEPASLLFFCYGMFFLRGISRHEPY